MAIKSLYMAIKAYSIQRVVLGLVFTLSSNLMWANGPLQRHKHMETYVKHHYQEALMQMERYSIPASIKIAQGLLETGGGTSTLAKDHNNHFGIKCHRSWQGKKTYRTDDAPNECFRSYVRWQDSYEDHSKFLKSPRYSGLFKLNLRDYQSWAKGLQQAGYATNKGYANGLIRIIETYELYTFDKGNLPSWMGGHKIRKKRTKRKDITPMRPTYISYDLLYILSNGNESFEDVAQETGISAKKLANYNDAPISYPLHQGDVIYLERKHSRSRATVATHIVEVGDSMHSIAQKYGLRMSALYKLNDKDEDYTPLEGEILRLR